MDPADTPVWRWGVPDLDPDGDAAFRSGDVEAAASIYRDIARRTGDYDVELRLLHCLDLLCAWEERQALALRLFPKLISEARGERAPGNEPLCYVSLDLPPGTDRAIAMRRTATVPILDHGRPRRSLGWSPGRHRVGVVSIDFRSHSGGTPVAPLFQALEGEGWDTVGISIAGPDQTIGNEHARCFGTFLDCAGMTVREASRRITSLELDVLIDTTRNIRGAATWLLNSRLAPVQLSGWGYGDVSGGTAIDGTLADDLLFAAVPSDADIAGDGSPAPMLRLPIYHPPVEVPVADTRDASPPSVPAASFGAFVNPYKTDRGTFRRLLRILKDHPGTTLMVLPGTGGSRDARQAEASDAGVEPDRVIFADRLDRACHLRRLSATGLLLDVSRMGGSATIPDGLAVGAPMIALAGGRAADRGGEAILRSIGRGDLVASGPDEFARLAADALGRPALGEEIARSYRVSPASDVKAVAEGLSMALITALSSLDEAPL